MLPGRVGGGIHLDVGVAGNDHRVSPTEAARRGIHLYVGPEGRPSRPWGAACLPSTDVDEGAANTIRADLEGRGLAGYNFRVSEHLMLGHVLAADGGEEASPSRVEVAPVFASRLLKNEVYPLSWTAAATCISCARVAIPVSWSMMAKPPSRVSMLVMGCSLSLQAAGPWRCRTVSRKDRSGGTRPLRRFQERSQRASYAASSWSQLSQIGIAAVSAGGASSPGCAGAMGCGEPAAIGAHRKARGASPAGMDPCWAGPPAPGAALGASSLSSEAVAWPAAWGGGRWTCGACHRDLVPSLEDVRGRLLVFQWGGSVPRVLRQGFQHRPTCVVLVCT